MFTKVLIANRGEIALRIIRACKELDIKTVAVYSTNDEDALHTVFADEAVCIGPSQSTQSYLNATRIISAAEITGAEAIHPGYGFLAENAEFAEMCRECEITFIGPSAEMIRRMGDKAEAKKSMVEAGVPVVPGSEGVVSDENEAVEIAREIGFPVILKAVAGGGGKGMRIVRDQEGLESNIMMARAEAEAAFGNPDLYIEKYIDRPRHIEIQLLGDIHGNMVYLGERECSIQRRHQKLIEESPSPVVSNKMRKEMGERAVMGAKHVGYYSTGTVEFLVDADLNYYFMEMNTRIQVEHPVTEMVYNVDLIKEQIRVAAGEKLTLKQSKLQPLGHAIECRINAEDPENNFIPSPGKITSFYQPGGPGVRVDTHIYANYVIPPYYDSLIAKLIAHGTDRQESISRLNRALDEFVIEGIKTTIPFHKYVINTPEFKSGEFDTHFIENIYNKQLLET
ncbi:acetyl-CoA carboxylase biotin carboxylase subunit [candidate division KSB1 bacterium 4484_188]|nr:MAG: acetyl-CoA carboxylase biotin carboxylase subunit [candidate division KSB1 bacterium 4484_188]HFE65117.1 acetyl-CoA carboxylase biotin carboxylase subunit [Caldithrix sp.]